MKVEHSNWIADNVTETFGRCAEVSLLMMRSFPELKRVRGHYYCAIWGERTHWWLVDEDGSIVDPTADQFPSKGMGVYDEWDDDEPEPTGKCPNCGELVYSGNYFCDDKCALEFKCHIMHG